MDQRAKDPLVWAQSSTREESQYGWLSCNADDSKNNLSQITECCWAFWRKWNALKARIDDWDLEIVIKSETKKKYIAPV